MTGTIYLLNPSPRSIVFADLIKYLKLDVTISDRDDPEYKKSFPLNKAPAYLSSDGWKLHEAIAIFQYLLSTAPEDPYKFFGTSERETAEVWQWVSFTNSDFISAIGTYVFRSKTAEEKASAKAALIKIANEFETRLSKGSNLVGDEPTLADIYAAHMFNWLIHSAFTKADLLKFPATAKWFRKVADTNPIASLSLKGAEPSA